MKFYHVTNDAAATAILARGFRDATGTYMTDEMHTGVWLSDRPLGVNQGCKGDMLLEVEIDLPPERFHDWEWVEEDKPYREWLMPAAFINGHAKVRRLADNDPELP